MESEGFGRGRTEWGQMRRPRWGQVRCPFPGTINTPELISTCVRRERSILILTMNVEDEAHLECGVRISPISSSPVGGFSLVDLVSVLQ